MPRERRAKLARNITAVPGVCHTLAALNQRSECELTKREAVA
jgi:hypothetical protein